MTNAGAGEVRFGPQSVEDERRTGKLIQKSEVVILREGELDCDLSTAIRRVRANANTSHSRILIIGEEEPRRRERLPVPDMPSAIADVVHRAGESALRRTADRQRPLVDSFGCFIGEARLVLQELDDRIENGSKAQLKKQVQVGLEVVEWLDAVCREFETTNAELSNGWQEVDTGDLLREQAVKIETFFPDLRVSVASGDAGGICLGQASALAAGFFDVLTLMAHRVAGVGGVRVAIEVNADRIRHEFDSDGEPHEVAIPELEALQAGVRRVFVERHGGTITPSDKSPLGCGLVIELPRRG